LGKKGMEAAFDHCAALELVAAALSVPRAGPAAGFGANWFAGKAAEASAVSDSATPFLAAFASDEIGSAFASVCVTGAARRPSASGTASATAADALNMNLRAAFNCRTNLFSAIISMRRLRFAPEIPATQASGD
jgi:hypothetical protein